MDRTLKAFLAVAQHANLTAAAARIGLTQPALTKSIRRLEDGLGMQLFLRTPRGMVLTEEGEMFLKRARAIDAHYRQAFEEADAHRSGVLQEFSIAAGAAYHMRIAPRLVKALSAEFPHTRFVLEFDVAASSLARLENGSIHLLLGAFVAAPPEAIQTRELMQVEIGAFCWRENPIARKTFIQPGLLREQPWVIYKRDGHMTQRLTSYYHENGLPTPRVSMEVDALSASFFMVRGTSYLTAAPTSLAGAAKDADLVRLPLEDPIWRFRTGVWYRKSSLRYPIVQRALALLEEYCRPGDNIPKGYSWRPH
ncbi:LysR family transcriptional regulator [Nitratireductor rhodophyticola]|uniref:LysR family transcriptional regulator n=1 Tax=Nitratireductor rhodophyticola TaxID=2854036 RepID=A0ABS7R9I4_9HYPH|nr:LysR family transcriptional regulator [Nitratireductor rhodophyticola]MBY8917050.1 LysR family transcriptional regulator [Nitratireductor rhodophyticola]MBY8920521.1 LysR family transcriptional regulator [Nitratireductor rhodophyticola]WPZ14801.1 LysR family transcriptional regulator [Nitratireductor rhodophyticola]